MAETTRNHIFSKEISQVIIEAMVLAPISIEKMSASDFSFERKSAFRPPRQTLFNKHILLVNVSKTVLAFDCLCDGQTDKHVLDNSGVTS